jgi:hypothetical protein
MRLEDMLGAMRAAGWTVGCHNDYCVNEKLGTFWLFTHKKSGRFVKGEATTDHDAVFLAVKEAGVKVSFGPDIKCRVCDMTVATLYVEGKHVIAPHDDERHDTCPASYGDPPREEI